MHPRTRLAALALAVLATVSATACGDSKLKNIPAGTPEDSVLKLFAEGAPADDTLPHVYRKESYFANSSNYDVLYYDPKGRKEAINPSLGAATPDSAPYKELTPVVFQNRKLAGAGWKFWDSLSAAIKVPVKKRD
jgi:hypothetical protein